MLSLYQLAKIAFFMGSVAAAPGSIRPGTIQVRQAPQQPQQPPPAPGAPAPPPPGQPAAPGQGLTDVDILQL